MSQAQLWSDDGAEAELIAELRLTLTPHVGPLTRQKLVEHFGSAIRVFEAKSEELRALDRIGPKIAKSLLEMAMSDLSLRELALCVTHGVQLVLRSHAIYPDKLHEIPDPPGVLFMRG